MTPLVFAVAFIVVALLVYVARYSGRLRVEEKRVIAAPLAEVYPLVADFGNWGRWSPWLEHEPEARVSLSGQPDGRAAVYAWDGERIGAGEIVHARLAPLRIEQRIRCLRPFRYRGRICWQFAERDGATEVTWSMRGRVGFALRAFARTVQGMIALDFRFGLDRLARCVEAAEGPAAAKHYALDYPGLRDIDPVLYVSRSYEGPLSGIARAVGEGIAALRGELAAAGAQASGEPIAVYVKTNVKLRTTVCRIGIPVEAAPDGLAVRDIPAHRAYVVRLTGCYSAMEVAWYQAMQRVRMEGLQPEQHIPPFERYLNDPRSVPERECVTELHIPVRPAMKS